MEADIVLFVNGISKVIDKNNVYTYDIYDNVVMYKEEIDNAIVSIYGSNNFEDRDN